MSAGTTGCACPKPTEHQSAIPNVANQRRLNTKDVLNE
jgi:hypothetical protein